MTLDELLLEWSYRSEKGYPSLDNPSDLLILQKILTNLDLPSEKIIHQLKEQVTISTDDELDDDDDVIDNLEDENPPEEETSEEEPPGEKDNDDNLTQKQGGSAEYDNLVKKTLGVETIPISQNSYKFQKGTFEEHVKGDDLKIWKDLWEAKPDKKTEKGVETAGVGKGEVSLYWLYHYSNSNVKVDEGRDGDDPDLFFNGDGVEVKAYKSHNSKLSIGRYGADKENLRLLSVIFGIATLARVFEGEGKITKTINPTNFAGNDLIRAFEHVIAFSDVDLDQLSEIYPVFGQIKKNIDYLDSMLDYTTAEEGAFAMARKFLKDKMSRKPGDGNHLVNLKKDGSMKFFGISFDTLNSSDDLLNQMGSSQSAMKFNFSKVF